MGGMERYCFIPALTKSKSMYKLNLISKNVDALSNEFKKSEALLHALEEKTFRVITQIANELYYFTDAQLDHLERTYITVMDDKYLYRVVLN